MGTSLGKPAPRQLSSTLCRVRRDVPDGAFKLPVVMQLDDLAGLIMLRCLLGEPHHEDGSQSEVRGYQDSHAPAADSCSMIARSAGVSPVVPTTTGTRRRIQGEDVSPHRPPGVVKSTTT